MKHQTKSMFDNDDFQILATVTARRLHLQL